AHSPIFNPSQGIHHIRGKQWFPNVEQLFVFVNTKIVAVIAPCTANVNLINYMRRNYTALHVLPDAATFDSFQGQENIIIIVIMDTVHPRSGPGFTQSKQRLHVLLTRH
ncbi:hypothetical protein EDB82DRAFT_554960, partial [Fusarium venenatum]|uniref:uncharacterized protein n=1 Tax=Fusarium venenatum TaxID=56646 RepID=UPI001DF8BEC3